MLFAHWVEAGEDGASALFSEARVTPIDRIAARCGCARCGSSSAAFERLIGAEPLALAVARAEGSASSRDGTSRYSAKNSPQMPM